jgi:glucose/arabinose dehydrogenase
MGSLGRWVALDTGIVIVAALFAGFLPVHLKSYQIRLRHFFEVAEWPYLLPTLLGAYLSIALPLSLLRRSPGDEIDHYLRRLQAFVLSGLLITIYAYLYFPGKLFSWNFFVVYLVLTLVLATLAHAVGTFRRQGRLDAALHLRRAFTSRLTLVLLAVALVGIGLRGGARSSPEFRAAIVSVLDSATGADRSTEWQLVEAFPGMRFDMPMEIVAVPGREGRVGVLGRRGRIEIVDASATPPARWTLLDLEGRVAYYAEAAVPGAGALGLAFHPRSGTEPGRGRLYVWYLAERDGETLGRLSEFTLGDDLRAADPDSERVLIEQLDRDIGQGGGIGHGGGGLAFGLDGFLYLSHGDEGPNHDVFESTQKIDENLFSGIFRIDVDRQGGEVSHPIRRQPIRGRTADYYIPNDNPFVAREGVLEEFWALGFRNPYRMKLDPETGFFWLGDVGQHDYEEINRIERAGNYQWSYREGPEHNLDSRFAGDDPDELIGHEVSPAFYYAHGKNRSAAIGGVVYRGSALPDLRGSYIYADNVSGGVYALELDGDRATGEIELVRTHSSALFGISAISEVDGQIYLAILGRPDSAEGSIVRLARIDEGSVIAPEAAQPLGVDDLYSMHCSRCHGSRGVPPDEMTRGVAVPPRNFTDPAWQDSVSDRRIADVIRYGGEANELSALMPAWSEVLPDDEDIRRLVDKVRSFDPDGGPES